MDDKSYLFRVYGVYHHRNFVCLCFVLSCGGHKCRQILGYSSSSQISGTCDSFWTLSVLFSSLIFYLKLRKPVRVVMVLIFGFCLIITGIIYSRIFCTARHHENQIQVLQIQVAQNDQIESVVKNRKSAISILYVYLVFLISYVPHHCVKVAYLMQSSPSTALDGVYHYSLTLAFLNSSLNPVVYDWKMRHIHGFIWQAYLSQRYSDSLCFYFCRFALHQRHT